MSELKGKFVSILEKSARGIAERLGYSSVSEAIEGDKSKGVESLLMGVIGTHLEGGLVFFDQTTIDRVGKTITQGGKVYSIDMVDGKLPEETIAFLAEGIKSINNYNAVIKDLGEFFQLIDEQLYLNNTFNIRNIFSVDDVKTDMTQISLAKDARYLAGVDMATLRSKTAGFENVLFYVFGQYYKGNTNLETFIQQVKDTISGDNPTLVENQKGAVELCIKACVKRGMERANACINVNLACRTLIGDEPNFIGTTQENYKRKMMDYRTAQYRLHEAYLGNTFSDAIEEVRVLREGHARLLSSREKIVNTIKFLEEQIPHLDARMNGLRPQISEKANIIKGIKDTRLPDDYENDPEYKALVSEYNKLVSEYNKYKLIKDVVVDKTSAGPKIISHNGVKYTINPLNILETNLSDKDKDIEKSIQKIAARDAQIVVACSSILYSLNFRAIGSELMLGLQTLAEYGYDNKDINFNSEQIRQALSIAKNLSILSLQDGLSNDKHLTQHIDSFREIIYNIMSNYAGEESIKLEDGSIVKRVPVGKINVELINNEIKKICSNSELPQYFGREKEIFEQICVSSDEVSKGKALQKLDKMAYSYAHADPKLSNFAYREALATWYKKNNLAIDFTKIKIRDIKLTLVKEYKPYEVTPITTSTTSSTTVVTEPVETVTYTSETPLASGPKKVLTKDKLVTKLNYSKQMGAIIRSQINSLKVASAVAVNNGENNDSIEHSIYVLTKVQHMFEQYYSGPRAEELFFKRCSKLTEKFIKTPDALSEHEKIFLSYCPTMIESTFKSQFDLYEAAIKDYNDKIDLYLRGEISLEDLAKAREGLVFGEDYRMGKSTSEIPPMIETSIKYNQTLFSNINYNETTHTFNINGFNFKDFTNMDQARDLLAGSIEKILNDSKFREFFTVMPVKGELYIVPSVVNTEHGHRYTNPTDKPNNNSEVKTVTPDKLDSSITVKCIEGGEIKEIPASTYTGKDKLVPLSENVVCPASQLDFIMKMGAANLKEKLKEIERELGAKLRLEVEAQIQAILNIEGVVNDHESVSGTGLGSREVSSAGEIAGAGTGAGVESGGSDPV